MIPDRLYELAFAYKKSKLWKRLWDTDVFAVERESGELAYTCVMGRLGEHCGVSAYTAEEFASYYRLLDTVESGVPEDQPSDMLSAMLVQKCSQLSFQDGDLLSPDEIEDVRAYVKAHGIRLSGKRAWPQFERYLPHHLPWYMTDRDDQERLADVLEACIALGGILAGHKAPAELGFSDIRREDVSDVPLMRKIDGAYVLHSFVPLPERMEEQFPEGPVPDPAMVRKLKSRFKKGALLCEIFWIPTPVQDDPGEAPCFPAVLMAVQEHNGMVLPATPVRDADHDQKELLGHFLNALSELKNLPKVWKVQDMRTCSFLKPAAESLGVKLELCDAAKLGALADAKEGLLDTFMNSEMDGDELEDDYWDDEIDRWEDELDSLAGEILSRSTGKHNRNTGFGVRGSSRNALEEDADIRIAPKRTWAAAQQADTLSEEDGKLFYKLWFPLLDYVNKRFKVNKKLKKMTGVPSLDPVEVKAVADYMWTHSGVISDYLAADGKDLPEEHRQIIAGWMHCAKGMFALERHLKDGSILISMDNEQVYKSVGIVSSWREMFMFSECPVLFEGTLIPFRDVIISDGLVIEQRMRLGSNLKKHLKELYLEAKQSGRIIARL